MVRPTLMILLSFALSACIPGIDREPAQKEVDRDLDVIRQDTLRVIALAGRLTYEVRSGHERGLEHDLIRAFADHMQLPVLFIEVAHHDLLPEQLRNGEGDLAIGLLGSRWIREQNLGSSDPHLSSHPAVITMRPDPWYAQNVRHRGLAPRILNPSVPKVQTISQMEFAMIGGSKSVEAKSYPDPPVAMIDSLALGRVEAVITNELLARTYVHQYPHLEHQQMSGPLVEHAIMLRSGSRRLRKTLDRWIKEEGYDIAQVLALKYAHPNSHRTEKAFSHPWHEGNAAISRYDTVFQQYADSLGWDWRLLTALAFKESRFDTSALSHKGAQGLMQLMPGTAQAMGHDSLNDPHGDIAASVRYLKVLDRLWRSSVKDPKERIGFILASYNAGPAHVLDARRLAGKLELDPTRWTGHTERALLLLSDPRYNTLDAVEHGYCNGSSTFLFVREVFYYWEHYRSLEIGQVKSDL